MIFIENLYTPDSIRTYSGAYVNVFNPDPATIYIEDIAHALSMQCRFGGHLENFYSVAQHSTECCILASQENKLPALMHDASEAYLLDVPRPVKHKLANYKEIENNLMTVIANKFGFMFPLPQEVKDIDAKMLLREWNCLMLMSTFDIGYKSMLDARKEFIRLFESLVD